MTLAASLRNLVADARAHGLTVIDLAAIERLLAEHDRRERRAPPAAPLPRSVIPAQYDELVRRRT